MSVLIDTSVLIAYVNTKDADHDRARSAMDAILRREHGEPLGPDVVLDEGLTLLLHRHPVEAVARRFAAFFWGAKGRSPILYLAETDLATLKDATDLYFRHFGQLSLTDCTLAVLARRMGASVATFDGRLKAITNALDI